MTGNRTLYVDRAGHQSPVPVIGILGGISAGKSLAACALAAEGARVVDADHIGHAVLREAEVVEALVRRFGPEIRNVRGGVDRMKLAKLVFADAESLAFLNALTHPRIRQGVAKAVEEAVSQGAPAVVIDAALLLEHNLGADRCTHLLFVDVPEAARRRRAAEARGWTEDEHRRRESSQWPLPRKRAAADVVIENAGDPREFTDRVVSWYRALLRADPPAGTP